MVLHAGDGGQARGYASFVVNVENTYAQDKDIRPDIDRPDGWTVTTGNGSELYVPDGITGSSYLWVYVPGKSRPATTPSPWALSARVSSLTSSCSRSGSRASRCSTPSSKGRTARPRDTPS